jgi:hypothetical protein
MRHRREKDTAGQIEGDVVPPRSSAPLVSRKKPDQIRRDGTPVIDIRIREFGRLISTRT